MSKRLLMLAIVCGLCVGLGAAQEGSPGAVAPSRTARGHGGYTLTVQPDMAATGLRGTLIDVMTDKPIAKAAIQYAKPGALEASTVLTDVAGAFEVAGIAPGEYVLTVEADGYASRAGIEVTVAPGAMSTADIRMRRRYPMGQRLLVTGIPQLIVVPLLAMWAALWLTRRRWRAPDARGAGPVARTLLGVGIGFVVGMSVVVLLSHIARRPPAVYSDPAVLRNSVRGMADWTVRLGLRVVINVAAVVTPFACVFVCLIRRASWSAGRAAILSSIGGVAAAFVVAFNPALSAGLRGLRNTLGTRGIPVDAWVLPAYLVLALVGSALVTGLAGMLASLTVRLVSDRRRSAARATR